MFTARVYAPAVFIILALVALPFLVSRPATNASAQQMLTTDAIIAYPLQDAWVDQANPATNYGPDTQLWVGGPADQRTPLGQEALIMFDLTALPPGATVSSALLELYQVKATGATRYEVFPDAVFGVWGEMTVNWDGKPPSDNLGDPSVSLDTSDGWKTWDVTASVSNWASGQLPNLGILLRGDDKTTGQRVFASREDPAQMPRLTIKYSLPDTCAEIFEPGGIPSPAVIDFDDLAHSAVIGDAYQETRGVTFENSGTTRALIYSNEPVTETHSPPNVAINDAVTGTSANVPMRITFDMTKTHVGMWIGNGEGTFPRATLTAFAEDGSTICSIVLANSPVPEAHSEFVGLYDSYGRVKSVALDYGPTPLSESIDDLSFSPATGEAGLPVISNILPSTWITDTQTPTVYASAIDVGSGLAVDSAFYRYSTDGGATWSSPQAASVSGANGVTTTQTITAASVPFNADSATQNVIEFTVADMMGNVGTAQGIVRIDTTRPLPPTSLTSSSHASIVWDNDNTVDISWSGASDATSGVSGYSVLFDRNASAIPAATVTTFGNSAISPPLADANDWYAHVRVRDQAGHWSDFVTRRGPFYIDTVAPSNPTSVWSNSHSTTGWTGDPTISMQWSGALDGLSGIDGYSFVFNVFPSFTPDTVVDTTSNIANSSALASGNTWYFHIRARDRAGNWSGTAVHRGPYYVDVTAPSSSASSPATSSGNIFTVSWSGSDAHSGVASYDVQYRNVTTGGSWINWKLATTSTSGAFSGLNGNIYQFRSRARDHAGNVEAFPSGYDSQTGVANVDVWARNPGIEVNQAVQDLNNSVTLIAGKRTFVRAYVGSDSGNINSVPARLRVYRGAMLMGTLSPANTGGAITVRQSPNRNSLNDAYYFDVPVAWLSAGSVTFTFDINSPAKIAENDYSNNTRSVTVSFVNSPVMNLLIVDVPYKDGGTVRNIRDLDRTLLESWLRRAYPIKTLNVGWAYLDPPYDSLPSAGTVNADLAWNKARAVVFDGEDQWRRYYGMAINTGGFMRGLAAGIPATVASGPTGPTGSGGWDSDGSFGDWYGGHELGHAYGRRHVTGAPYAGPGSCGDEGGPDGGYPYPGGDISPTRTQWSSNAIYGFDRVGPAVYPPSWKDVMTYCNNQWISDYTYENIYNRMVAEKPLAAAQGQQMIAAGVEHLGVFGSVTIPTDTVTLNAFYRVPDSFDAFGRDASGEYHIRLLGAGDSLLADYPFSPRHDESSDEPIALISEMVPWVDGTRKVAITHGATVLFTRNVSANAPAVAITSPNGGETLSGGSVTVTWNASDPDGDALTYSLDYSRDGGATWEPFSRNLTSPQIALDLSKLPGTTVGRFRVWASDGVNTAVDASDGNFTVAGKAPTIVSIAPTSGQTYVVSQTVTFEGQAFDAEDGLLADNRLEWSSDLAGDLGAGALLQTVDLAAGTHTITLTATDGDNNVTQATTTVVIAAEAPPSPPVYELFLPIITRSQ